MARILVAASRRNINIGGGCSAPSGLSHPYFTVKPHVSDSVQSVILAPNASSRYEV